MKKLTKLTWKYFCIRKFIEILIVLAFIFIPYLVGLHFYECDWRLYSGVCGDSLLDWWGKGIWACLSVVVALGLILLIIAWNWDRAEKKAKDMLYKSRSKLKKRIK